MNSQTAGQFPTPAADRRGWPWRCDEGTRELLPIDQDRNSPRVSIITPSFNQGRYLEETIRSVLLQDYPNIEYILIDGGSIDESVNIIERYDPWISYWISEPDHGQADAINKGFGRATGEYLCWLNSDDVFYQGFVSRRVEEFSCRPEVDLIFGDVHSGWDDRERNDFCGESLSYLDMLRTLRVSIPQQSAVWRKSAIDRLGGLDPRWNVVLDREFFLRIARHGPVEYIPGISGFFRQHTTAKSVAETKAWTSELPRLYAEFFAVDELTPEEAGVQRETMAAVHLLCADILRASQDWGGSLTHLARAVGWSPKHAVMGFAGARIKALRHRRVKRAYKQDNGKVQLR